MFSVHVSVAQMLAVWNLGSQPTVSVGHLCVLGVPVPALETGEGSQ